MEYFEFVRTAFLVVGFLLAMTRDRATWMTVDLIVSIIAGLSWVFIPQIMLEFQTEGELTGVHLVMCRWFGVIMLGTAVKMYFNYQSRDNYSQVMLLASKIVGASLLMVTFLHSVYGPASAPVKANSGNNTAKASASGGVVFSEQMISFMLTMLLGGLVGCVVWFFKARHFGGHTSLDSRLNTHLRIDFFVTLLVGVTWMAYLPTIMGNKMGLSSPDVVQLHFGQCCGGLLIGDAILSAVAPGFLFEEDKRNILLGRIVMILGYFCMNAHAIITYDDYKENSPWLSLAVSGLWLGNTALGCYAPHETEAYSRSKYDKDSDKDSDSDSD